MGTVFQVPWTRIDWKRDREILKDSGFSVAAFALAEDSISLDELASDPPERLAIVLGAEGGGLSDLTVADCDFTVRIPMAGGVDSLNVAAAAAVAMWALRVGIPIGHIH
jgi:tRNA G18 (ribose-2'-O)-methylase SpoU